MCVSLSGLSFCSVVSPFVRICGPPAKGEGLHLFEIALQCFASGACDQHGPFRVLRNIALQKFLLLTQWLGRWELIELGLIELAIL